MLTHRQFQSKLLEIALLPLLEASGYRYVSAPDPPMVLQGNNGLEIPGRGAFHQIDGIADFFLSPPLSHRHRLLAEGKFYKNNVGIEVIRNGVGVLKDVSEYWITVPSAPPSLHQFASWQKAIPKSRYHYQYAVIASTSFTVPAQSYAFAHDIYLFPLGSSTYFQPVIQAIKALEPGVFDVSSPNATINLDMIELQKALLSRIFPSEDTSEELPFPVSPSAHPGLEKFCQACREIKVALVGTLGEQFPLIFIPHPKRVDEQIMALLASEANPQETAQFHRDPQGEGWFLHYRGENLFSFDFPERLFQLYVEQNAFVWTRNADGETVLRLDAPLVNLHKFLGGDFDTRVHQIELQITQEDFDHMRAELDRKND